MNDINRLSCFDGVFGRITYYDDGEEISFEGTINITSDFWVVVTDADGKGVAALPAHGFARIEAISDR